MNTNVNLTSDDINMLLRGLDELGDIFERRLVEAINKKNEIGVKNFGDKNSHYVALRNRLMSGLNRIKNNKENED
jgi:hypothetical protein